MAQAVIFDFDDTLEEFKYPKTYSESKLGEYVNKKYAIPKNIFCREFDDIDFHFVNIGKKTKEPAYFNRILWMQQFFYNHKLNVSDKKIIKLVAMYWKNIYKKIKLLHYAEELLKYLKDKGFKLALITDSDGTKSLKLERVEKLRIKKYFDIILTGDDVNSTKPDMKFYNIIFKKLKVAPKDCWMVGDKPPFDLQLAKKLGMKTIWMQHGRFTERMKGKKFNYVDYKVNDLKEIIKIINLDIVN